MIFIAGAVQRNVNDYLTITLELSLIIKNWIVGFLDKVEEIYVKLKQNNRAFFISALVWALGEVNELKYLNNSLKFPYTY